MATFEITVSTTAGEHPKVIGMRRLGTIKALWARFTRRRRGETDPKPEIPANRGMVDLRTIDIVMNVPYPELQQQILKELSGTADPEKVRLVFCLPTGRKETPAEAVEL